jgi:hypothetical protein
MPMKCVSIKQCSSSNFFRRVSRSLTRINTHVRYVAADKQRRQRAVLAKIG